MASEERRAGVIRDSQRHGYPHARNNLAPTLATTDTTITRESLVRVDFCPPDTRFSRDKMRAITTTFRRLPSVRGMTTIAVGALFLERRDP